jgi:hypothetical protein
MSSNFRNLTTEGCKTHYLEMKRNSDMRWESALFLSSRNDYGGAITDHINSIEELVKSMIMAMDSRGFEFRSMEDIDIIMRRNHVIRHFIGFITFSLHSLFSGIGNFAKYDTNIEKLEALLKDEAKMKQLMKIRSYRMMIKIKRELIKFEELEYLRQNGKHVDLDANNKMRSPFDFTPEDYNDIYERLRIVHETLGFFIESYLSEEIETNRHIEKLKKQFIDENWYIQLNGLLKISSKRKNTPFKHLKNEFLTK